MKKNIDKEKNKHVIKVVRVYLNCERGTFVGSSEGLLSFIANVSSVGES